MAVSLTVIVLLAALSIALVAGLSLVFPLLGLRLHQAAMRQRAAESAAAPLAGRLQRSETGLLLTLTPKPDAVLPLTIREWTWPPSLADATGVITTEPCEAQAGRAAGEPLRWRSTLQIDATGLDLSIAARAPGSGAGTLALWLEDAAGRPSRLWLDLPVRAVRS